MIDDLDPLLDAIAERRRDAEDELIKYIVLNTALDAWHASLIARECASAAREGRRVMAGGIASFIFHLPDVSSPSAFLSWFTL